MAAWSSVTEQQSFFTPQEVSELLRVSVYTVRRWIRQGDLPAYKVGRGWRINVTAIDEWLNQHESTTTQRQHSTSLYLSTKLQPSSSRAAPVRIRGF